MYRFDRAQSRGRYRNVSYETVSHDAHLFQPLGKVRVGHELEDPRFQTEYWREQIELQLDIDKKAEQQALASRGLDFVTDTYLPERLAEMGVL